MFQKKIAKKIKTQIYIQQLFFRKSCRVCDNVKKLCTAREVANNYTIRRMRFAYWVTNTTNIHSEYEILIAFARQHLSRERALVLRYVSLSVLFTYK